MQLISYSFLGHYTVSGQEYIKSCECFRIYKNLNNVNNQLDKQ